MLLHTADGNSLAFHHNVYATHSPQSALLPVWCVLSGQLILCEPTMAAREAAAAKVAAETGAAFIPPYDYGPVIAGQGTIGLELLQQVLTPIEGTEVSCSV
jgi:threonine dehydratase